MSNFGKTGSFKSFDGRSFDSKKRFNGRRSSFNNDRRLIDAVCDNCGKTCKVPFVPTGGKPVYCDDCYRQFGGKEKGQKGRSDLSEINRKLDKIIEMLER